MVKLDKEIHFYTYLDPEMMSGYYTLTWDGTIRAISKNTPFIGTLQMGLLSASLFEKGYRIFIHESPIDSYEIKLGCENERTNREIRVAHNLFKMWKAGEFKKKENICETTKETDS